VGAPAYSFDDIALSGDGTLLAGIGLGRRTLALLQVKPAAERTPTPARPYIPRSMLGEPAFTEARSPGLAGPGVRFSPHGGTMVTFGLEGGGARLWQPVPLRPFAAVRGRAPRYGGVPATPVVAPGGRMIAAAGARGVVLIDADSGSRTRFLGTRSVISEIAFSRLSHLVAASSFDGNARVWSTASRSLVAKLDGGGGRLGSIALSPDGRRGDDVDGAAVAREFADQRPGRESEQASAAALARRDRFSADGRRIITAGDDGTARVWDTRSLALRAELRPTRGQDGERPPIVVVRGCCPSLAGSGRSARLLAGRSREFGLQS
jgi:WD40 repeat protein